MATDLDRDVNINGHEFKAGKNVDTKVTDIVDGKAVTTDYADGIKEVLKANQVTEKLADPLEATKRMNGIDQPNPVTEEVAPTNPIVDIKGVK